MESSVFRCDEAVNIFQDVVSHYEKSRDPNDPVLGVTYSDLAQALTARGDFDEAISLCEKALDIVMKIEDEGKRRDTMFHVHHNMGRIYEMKGMPDEALRLHLYEGDLQGNGLRQEQSVYGAWNLYAVGNCLQLQKDPRAIETHTKALKIREDLLGDHYFTAISYYKLSQLYMETIISRHFGYYEYDTRWPFPIGRALRRMVDKLAESLNVPPGAYVLDAGCGVGHVALHMATKYKYRVQAIDVVAHHVDKAKRNVARARLPDGQVNVRLMDYHHLESLDDESFDGIYTMETFVHATDPKAVLAGFYQKLRPGGHLALNEYDHEFVDNSPDEMANSMRKINDIAAMPTNDLSNPGVFKDMLEEAGFTDVVVRDYSEKIKPMTRLFYLVAYIPWLIVTFLGLEKHFINTVAGVETYRGHGRWRYDVISATKPGGTIESAKAR
ncbi:hypothetical protein IL306_008868 [Fusarium sp. DS 682]|nr:hypothetical protein IL306_008868 [Fusarium sp. DS 682]